MERKQMDHGLCWCEYIDKTGEHSHILAALCNCDAVDEAFDRLITCKSIENEHSAEIFLLAEDRLRIPWPGGARKFPVDIALALTLVPSLIILGTLNVFFTAISYIIILPFIIYVCHFLIRKRYKVQCINNVKDQSKLEKPYVSVFYFTWLLSSIFILFIIYYIEVIGSMKILSSENFIFLLLFVSSCTCFYIVRAEGRKYARTFREKRNDEAGESKWCPFCSIWVPEEATHCKLCNICYKFRDHHCLWLNTCICQHNDRWFVIGLILAFSCIVYGAHLAFTSVCHPLIFTTIFMDIYYPSNCSSVYGDFSSALTFSAAWYAVALSICVGSVMMLQITSILQGRRIARRFLFKDYYRWQLLFLRFFRFWCRD